MTIFLMVWSIVAFGWWLTALILLARGCRQKAAASPAARPTVTVFKPLPPVRNESERAALADAIGSFVGQLRPGDELLVGMDAADAVGWQTAVQQWRASWPSVQINVMAREVPRQCANPKIAWMQVLAPSARGDVWVWSDADVAAPAGFLDQIHAELAGSGDNAVTAAYAVQHVGCACGILDALFVNVEFLPGALLLGRMGRQDFAYGAATAFRAETFHAKGDWHRLGAALADDYTLGQQLQPVKLSGVIVSTFTKPTGWVEAWQHYYRWQKTVRWCRPGGYAALLVLMPAFGWALASVLCAPKIFFLSGLGAVLCGEVLVGMLACRFVGCRMPALSWCSIALWPFFRVAAWLLVWLPFPALWSGRQRKWFSPRQE